MNAAAIIGLTGAMLFGDPGAGGPPEPIDHLRDRLSALSPDDPPAYFDLAEEIAYEIPSDRGRELATTLFVLALEQDERAERPTGVGASACLALADLSAATDERQWLIAIADSLRPEALRPVWTLVEFDAPDDQAALRVAEALVRFRSGDRRSLKGLRDRLNLIHVLTSAGLSAPRAVALRRQIERVFNIGPPSMAGGRRIDRDPADRGRYRLHPENGGNPGPALDAEPMLLQLQAEAVLVDAEASSWATQLIIDRGAPLRSIDPRGVAARFRVDTALPYWIPDLESGDPIDGAWSATAAGGADVR